MISIQQIAGPYALPQGSICLGPNGWTRQLYVTTVDKGGMDLQEVLQHLWVNHAGLLGHGSLTFMVSQDSPRETRGLIVFHPYEWGEAPIFCS